MPPRIITPRGMRAFDRTIALPRETQAAARAIAAAKSKAGTLAKAQTVEAVSDVLDDSFAEAMQNMAIKRDPHVSMYGMMRFLLDDSAVTVPDDANFFVSQAGGVAATGNPAVWHNLLDDRQPLKPCLIHNIGVSVHILSSIGAKELATIGTARLILQRGKEDLFEFPLSHALVALSCTDAAADPGTVPQIADINPLAGGGIELEGHGAPYLMDEALGLELDWPWAGNFMDQETGITGMVTIIARVDGEVMEV